MGSILTKAIKSAQQSEIAFCKFITANDTGSTGSHQSGFHIHKHSWKLFFDSEGVKGENKDRHITIRWQDEFETSSRFTYYGVGTRNEYRLTRFGRGFPFLLEECIGDLLVISQRDPDFYEAYVLQSDEDIESFFAALNISATDTNGIIPKQNAQGSDDLLIRCFDRFLRSLTTEFPSTHDLATSSRTCYNNAHGVTSELIRSNPDSQLLNWIDAEFQLFKYIENDRYTERIKRPFYSVEELVQTANTILNRRKSRAGKSLEHHLEEIFKVFYLSFSTQANTEDNKKPDFLFPNAEAYHDKNFRPDKLVMLASKTTCKDRWRQILNEADRIKIKHLFTLQQGISRNQLEEMYKYNVCLVVPKPYLSSYPKEFRARLLTLDDFVSRTKITQE